MSFNRPKKANYFNINPNELLNDNNEFQIPLSNNVKNLKTILSELMQKTGLINITLLHKYSGIPISVLSEILSGKTEKPNIKTLQKLANLFNLTIPQLLGTNPISDKQIINIHTYKKSIPILPLNKIDKWIRSAIELNSGFININRELFHDKAFAISINDSSLEPDFKNKSILIIDKIEHNSGDFIVGNYNGRIHICEYEEHNEEYFIRLLGSLSWLKIEHAQIEVFGVVVQQIMNFK